MAEDRIIQVRQNNGLYEDRNIETLDDMPASDYMKFFKDRIKHAVDRRRFDVARIVGGQVIAADLKPLFNIPLNGDAKTLDGGTTYKKDRGDTNMKENNKLEYGHVLIVESVQVSCLATSREYAALTAGEPTSLAPAAEGTEASSLTVTGLGNNVNLRFAVDDKVKTENPLICYPPDFGYSGSYGNAADEGFTQFGFGRANMLRQIVVLRPGQYFTVLLDFLRSLTIPQSVDLKVMLCGVELEPVK
jgi:hypothetical protein